MIYFFLDIVYHPQQRRNENGLEMEEKESLNNNYVDLFNRQAQDAIDNDIGNEIYDRAETFFQEEESDEMAFEAPKKKRVIPAINRKKWTK